MSCVEAIQNRAMRFVLGLKKYAPNQAVGGDMGWSPTPVRQWGSVTRLYMRLRNLPEERQTYRIFKWSHHWARRRKRKHVYRVHGQLEAQLVVRKNLIGLIVKSKLLGRLRSRDLCEC